MTALKITRLLPAISLACAMGMIAPALAQTTTTAPAPAASTMAPAAPASTPAAPATTTTATTAKPVVSSAKLPAADEFKTTALATAHCPGDTVVWSTLSKSKSYHLASSKYYGKTKHGAYVCEKDATAAGFHASKE